VVTILVVFIVLLLAYLLNCRGLNAILFSYMVLTPMRALVSVDDYILGVIGPDNIPAIILTLIFILDRNKQKISIKHFQGYPVFLLLLFFIIGGYIIDIKAYYLYDSSVIIKTNNIIRDSIYIIAFYYVVTLSESKYRFRAIEMGFIIGSAIIAFSIFNSDLMEEIGLITGFSVEDRASGFLQTNPNVAGAICSIVIGFIIARYHSRTFIANPIFYLLAAILLLFGIIGTGSRQALLSVVIVTLFYMYLNKYSFIKLFSFSLLIIIGSYIVINYGNLLIERVTIGIEEERPLASRPQHWLWYMAYILNNPKVLIFGNYELREYIYDSHNYYIRLLYSLGIPGLSLFIILIKKYFITSALHNTPPENKWFVVLPLLFTSFFNSHVVGYMVLFAMLLIHDRIDENDKQNDASNNDQY
jgi:hypothetical protein